MNRFSWDSTAPRRLTGRRPSAAPRPEAALEEEAALVRVGWDRRHRVGPFG